MEIGLVLTICAALAGSGEEQCDNYIVETYDSVIPCMVDLDKNLQTRDDRYLSCTAVDTRYLQDRKRGRSVSQIIADINAEG